MAASEALRDPAAARPAGGAVLDLHTHSRERSLDSGVAVDALVARAAERGLDGICLTEHNATWRGDELTALGERHGVAVLPAMELGTDVGHVLVYGLDRYTPELLRFERLQAVVQAEGAAMVLAHPMRPYDGRRPGWDEIGRVFAGIEAINGDHSDSEDGYYVGLAAQLGIAAVGGSDVHSVQAVGRAVTVFEQRVPDVATLVRLLVAGRAAPVDLRPRAR